MKRETITLMLNGVEDGYISEAAVIHPASRQESPERTAHMKKKRIITAALAAALILVLGVSAFAIWGIPRFTGTHQMPKTAEYTSLSALPEIEKDVGYPVTVPEHFSNGYAFSMLRVDGEAVFGESYEVLKDHPINIERKKKGLNPANCFWFWGAGRKPKLVPFEEKFGKKAVMISAVDLLKGLGVGTQMKVIRVPGVTGGLETNYEGKAEAAVSALLKDGYDFAYIHVEAPDEMGHQGSVTKKIQSIENLDQRVIRIVWEALKESGEDFRILVLPDHPTPIRVRTHTSDPVPYLLYDSTAKETHDWKYNEREGLASGNDVGPGPNMIVHLFG